jgi:hypothetical protein
MRRTTTLCASALMMTAVACSDDEPTASRDTSPSETSTTSTTEPDGPQPMNVDEFVDVEPGTYFVDPDGDESTPLRVVYDVRAEGWTSWAGAVKQHPTGHTMLNITAVDNLATQACEDPSPRAPPVGPTVDDLATALSQLAPFELTEPPTDVTLLGHQGKHLKLTVPNLELRGTTASTRTASAGTSTPGSSTTPAKPSSGTTQSPGGTRSSGSSPSAARAS